MQYSFRLAELLGHVPDPRKRPGTVKAIVEYTGLDRHQVAALLKNEVKYLSLRALSRLCDYLVEHGYATADQLPGALFAVEAENYWELLVVLLSRLVTNPVICAKIGHQSTHWL